MVESGAAKRLETKGYCTMRKTLTVLTFVTLVLVLLASPVLAVGPSRGAPLAATWPKYHIISFTGTAASWTATTLTVNVQLTNKPYIVKRGTQVTVSTTSRTVYYIWDGKTRTRTYSLSGLGLTTGAKVSINATVYSTGAITANRVEVYKPRYAP
jgi:hypothetical protein